MDATLHIQGMHCHACAQLIRMELEDGNIPSDAFEVTPPDATGLGKVELKSLTPDQVEQAKNLINAMATYQVVNPS